MSPSPLIRSAIPRDASAIAGVYVYTWRDAYPTMIPDAVLLRMSHRRQRAYWAGVLAQRGMHAVMVAEDARAGIVGFGSCGRARTATLPYRGEVHPPTSLPISAKWVSASDCCGGCSAR